MNCTPSGPSGLQIDSQYINSESAESLLYWHSLPHIVHL